MAALTSTNLFLAGKNNVVFLNKFCAFFGSCIKNLSKYNETVSSREFKLSQENKMANKFKFQYPEARRDESVVDNFFGVQVEDPYRWLENPDGLETVQFVQKQNVITKNFLTACPYQSSIKKTLEHMWDYPKYSCPFYEGQRYFFYKNTGLQHQSVLYIQKRLDSEPSVFFDPNALSEDGTVSLSISQFSEDGSYFAYGLSSSGSDWITIKIMNVQTQEEFPEELKRVKFSTISWTHDNKGFFYGMYPSPNIKDHNHLETVSDEHQKLYYHRIGTPQSEDVLVLDFPDEPKFRISTDVSHCGRYLIVYLQKGCRDNLVYFCDFERIGYKITGRLPIIEVVNKLEADYEYVTNTNSEFIFRTNKNAPNYRLIKIYLESTNPDSWKTLIREHPLDVLDWAVCVNKNKLIICYMHDVKDVLQYRELSDGRLIREFSLGMGSVVGFSGKKKLSEIFFKFVSFLTPGIIYHCDLDNPKLDCKNYNEVKPKGFDKELFETHQVFYFSKDGTKIPMFLVYKKGLEKNSKNPCLLYGYGGFNISIKPYFNVVMTVFMTHLGGVWAIANIRGGGEYGERWHNQGRFENKQNCFDDFQAAAEFLINKGYTSSKYLTIKGDSNGGLLVSACAIQRPDLFGAVLCGVGVMDMLRFHKFTIGSSWVSDYGTPEVQKQFEYLYSYSPLHNIKIPSNKDVQYPAMLLSTADHDDRVVPLHSLKFIATLHYVMRKRPEQTNPLLIRVDTKAGHGAGKPTYKMIEEATDQLSFIIQALNLKFQT